MGRRVERLEWIVWAAYLLIGPVTWAVVAVLVGQGRKKMRLGKSSHRKSEGSPRATIVIPAKDEGERIRDCIVSALRQEYSNFSVLAVDDRSTDRTGAVMDELAVKFAGKLKVVHIPAGGLRAGWTGKCNALYTAVGGLDRIGEGDEWLLFIDSDVVLEPRALAATVGLGAGRKYDMVSLLIRAESHSFWEGLLVPLAGIGLTTLYLVALTNDDETPTAFANGQYLMIRRSVYDAIGGHEAVKDRYCEDIDMARVVKGKGYKVRIFWGPELAAVRMYSSLESIFKGWARIFFSASVGRPWRILLGMSFVAVCGLSAYAALVWGLVRVRTAAGAIWLAAAGVHLAIMTAFLAAVYAWSGNRRRNALWFPIGAGMLLGIFAKALRMCATGKVEWRGTRYGSRRKEECRMQNAE